MDNLNLIDTFSEFKDLKNIDRATMMSVLEDAFRSVIQKQFGSDENFDVIINPDKGDFEIYRNRTVVEDGALTDLNTEITITAANANNGDYELGEELTDTIRFSDF